MKNRTPLITGGCAGLFVFISALSPVFAQAPGAAGGTLPILRKNATISQIDQKTIQTWVDQQMDTLFASNTLDTDAAKFRAALDEHHNANDATPAFKQAEAAALADSLARRYKGSTTEPLPVVYSLLALQVYDDPAALAVSRQAMLDASEPPAPAVRAAGLANLLRLRDRINAQTWTGIVADAQKTAASTNDPIVLQSIYRLLAADTPQPRAQEGVTAIRAILEARLAQYEKKGETPPLAERDAALWLGTQAAALPNAQRVSDIAGVLGRLLSDAAFAYVNQKWTPTGKENLERVILAAEQGLRTIATAKAPGRQTPNVMRALEAVGPDQGKHITEEVNKWIGSPAAPGFLNQAPFNLPAGLNIQRTVPTTNTATATAPG